MPSRRLAGRSAQDVTVSAVIEIEMIDIRDRLRRDVAVPHDRHLP